MLPKSARVQQLAVKRVRFTQAHYSLSKYFENLVT